MEPYKYLLRAPFRDEWRGLLGLAARRSHADKRIPSAPRSSSLGPHSGQHAAVLRPEDFPLRSLPVLSSAAGEMYLLPPRSTTIPSSPQRPARCISCRRGARRPAAGPPSSSSPSSSSSAVPLIATGAVARLINVTSILRVYTHKRP